MLVPLLTNVSVFSQFSERQITRMDAHIQTHAIFLIRIIIINIGEVRILRKENRPAGGKESRLLLSYVKMLMLMIIVATVSSMYHEHVQFSHRIYKRK